MRSCIHSSIVRSLHPSLQSVSLHTDLGDIKVELHCDLVPKACEVSSQHSSLINPHAGSSDIHFFCCKTLESPISSYLCMRQRRSWALLLQVHHTVPFNNGKLSPQRIRLFAHQGLHGESHSAGCNSGSAAQAHLFPSVHVLQNFLALCASGYYNDSVFHRCVSGSTHLFTTPALYCTVLATPHSNIKGFMVQTGDPTGEQCDGGHGQCWACTCLCAALHRDREGGAEHLGGQV